MSPLLKKLEQDALRLPQDERAFLADRLLSSLSGDLLNDVESAWVEEVERRYQEHKDGKRKGVPASEVFEDADRLLK